LKNVKQINKNIIVKTGNMANEGEKNITMTTIVLSIIEFLEVTGLSMRNTMRVQTIVFNSTTMGNR